MSQEKVGDLAKDLGTNDFEPWIGVDLDGTLAVYNGWVGMEHIGEPIEPMMERVREWLRQGMKVKIFTARARDEMQKAHIRRWLRENDLPELEITNVKDYQCVEVWDDRAIRVVKNVGVPCCDHA